MDFYTFTVATSVHDLTVSIRGTVPFAACLLSKGCFSQSFFDSLPHVGLSVGAPEVQAGGCVSSLPSCFGDSISFCSSVVELLGFCPAQVWVVFPLRERIIWIRSQLQTLWLLPFWSLFVCCSLLRCGCSVDCCL